MNGQNPQFMQVSPETHSVPQIVEHKHSVENSSLCMHLSLELLTLMKCMGLYRISGLARQTIHLLLQI